jgi:Putative nucleotidyltransferase substrate binding domain
MSSTTIVDSIAAELFPIGAVLTDRPAERAQAVSENPNLLRLDSLSELDLRILKEVFRQTRKLQQRIELDYGG